MDSIYISPYLPTERIRHSVLALKANNKTIHEVYEHDSRLKPHFDEESFAGALGTITVLVEGVCLAPVARNDRATMSLFEELANLEHLLHKFLLGVHGWANKAKYFNEVAGPFIVRTLAKSKSEASTAKKLRKELDYVGPIETIYVRSFDSFPSFIEGPILELRELGEFIASILKDGDEISSQGSAYDRPSALLTVPKPSPSKPSSHFAKILDPVAEASSSRSIETKSALTLPTTSPHLNTILNPEPATQASASGPVKTDNMTDQHRSNAFEDLLQAAAYPSGTNKSPSPSYSPPHSPSLSANALLNPISLPYITAEEHSLEISSSMLLRPSPLYVTNRAPAPPSTPQWKIDLSERKGHPINALHVGPQELDVLTECLKLVNSATQKGEECMRDIIHLQNLASEMAAEYAQWDDFCMDLEDNVSIKEKEARQKTSEQFGYTKVDDAKVKAKGQTKGKGKARDTTLYAPTTAHESIDGSFFEVNDPSIYSHVEPQAPESTWGYRKVAPSSVLPSNAKSLPGLASLAEDPDETEDDEGAIERVKRSRKNDLDTTSQASTERAGSPMSVSYRTDGVEEVIYSEVGGAVNDDGGDGDGDEDMQDVGVNEGNGNEL